MQRAAAAPILQVPRVTQAKSETLARVPNASVTTIVYPYSIQPQLWYAVSIQTHIHEPDF